MKTANKFITFEGLWVDVADLVEAPKDIRYPDIRETHSDEIVVPQDLAFTLSHYPEKCVNLQVIGNNGRLEVVANRAFLAASELAGLKKVLINLFVPFNGNFDLDNEFKRAKREYGVVRAQPSFNSAVPTWHRLYFFEGNRIPGNAFEVLNKHAPFVSAYNQYPTRGCLKFTMEEEEERDPELSVAQNKGNVAERAWRREHAILGELTRDVKLRSVDGLKNQSHREYLA